MALPKWKIIFLVLFAITAILSILLILFDELTAIVNFYLPVFLILLFGFISFLFLVYLFRHDLKSKIERYLDHKFALKIIETTLVLTIIIVTINATIKLFFNLNFLDGNVGYIVYAIIFIFCGMLICLEQQPMIKKSENNLVFERKKYPYVVLMFFLIFILVKIAVILRYPNPFQDGWKHIVVGLKLLTDGKFFTIDSISHGGYIRGYYISSLVALFFKLFGLKILVAKTVPAIVGLINIWLLYLIAKKVLLNKYAIYFLLFITTINYWTIVNHAYIRMYVFYEFLILLILWLAIKTITAMRQKKLGLSISYLLVIISINIVSWPGDDSFGLGLLLISTIIVLVYIYFFEAHHIQFNSQRIIFKPINYLLAMNRSYKLIGLLFLALPIGVIFDAPTKIIWLMYAKIPGGPSEVGFMNFFFSLNILTTTFFFSSLLVTIFIRNTYQRLTIILASCLLFIHLFSNPGIQVIRAILYFIPLYLLTATISFNYVINTVYQYKKILAVSLSIIILFGFSVEAFNNYPKNYKNKLTIIGGGEQYDYDSVYDFVKNNTGKCTMIFVMHETLMSLFYNAKIDYKIGLRGSTVNAEDITHYFDKESGYIREISNNTPVITSGAELKKLLAAGPTCVVMNAYAIYSFLGQDTYNYITTNCQEEYINNPDFGIYQCD